MQDRWSAIVCGAYLPASRGEATQCHYQDLHCCILDVLIPGEIQTLNINVFFIRRLVRKCRPGLQVSRPIEPGYRTVDIILDTL